MGKLQKIFKFSFFILFVGIFLGLANISFASKGENDWDWNRYDGHKPFLCDRGGKNSWDRFGLCKEKKPLVYLFATKYAIKAGNSTTMYWDAKRADSCSVSGSGWSGDRAVKAEEVVSPSVTTKYTITCTNEFGSYTDSATITVKGKPNNPPPPTDVCPNIDGVQESVPSGYHLEDNQCLVDEEEPVDVCSNIDGVQETIPDGYRLEDNQCVIDEEEPVDLCPNLAGDQATIPVGYHDESGQCVADEVPPTDVCPNIDGLQETIPNGYHKEGNDCIQDTPNPTLDHLIISEVYYDVGTGKGEEPENEWIEIYNGTGLSVDISNWVVADASTQFDLVPQGTTIPNLSFVILTASSTTSGFWGDVPVVNLNTSRLGNSLGNNPDGDSIYLKNAASSTVDSLSYGSNVTVFNPSVPLAPANGSIKRTDLTVDTNTAADWATSTTPTPGSF